MYFSAVLYVCTLLEDIRDPLQSSLAECRQEIEDVTLLHPGECWHILSHAHGCSDEEGHPSTFARASLLAMEWAGDALCLSFPTAEQSPECAFIPLSLLLSQAHGCLFLKLLPKS